MLHTPLCSLLGISVPIIQGALGGPWSPSPALAAAVSEAGGLGTLPTALRRPEQVREDIATLRDMTDRPYAINHTMKPFVEEVFAEILGAAPPVVSFALGCSTDLISRAHDAGSLFVQQVHSVAQALDAAEAGADVLIAQGDEAGGFGGSPCSTMVLVPQVVDAVAPLPVVAAGGIADGRALAAVLALGAQAGNVGTRFIASYEADLAEGYKRAVLGTRSAQTVRAAFVNELVPLASPGAYASAPRVVRNAFVDEWYGRDDDVRRMQGELAARVGKAMQEDRLHELVVIAGEVAGTIDEVLPAAEIVGRMATGAEQVLRELTGG